MFLFLWKVCSIRGIYHSETEWLLFPSSQWLNSEAQVECGNGIMGNDIRHFITHNNTSAELIRAAEETDWSSLSQWVSSHRGRVSERQERLKVAHAASSRIYYWVTPLQRPSMHQTGSLPPHFRNILSSSLQLITTPPFIIPPAVSLSDADFIWL